MNGNFDDEQLMAEEQQRNKSGVLQGLDQISSHSKNDLGTYGEKKSSPKGLNGFEDDKMSKKDKADVDAINNRGKNDTNINGSKKSKKGDDDDGESSGSKDKLDKNKDGVTDKSKDSTKEDLKDKAKDKVKDEAKDKAAEKAVEAGAGKSLLVLKVKIIFWVAVVCLGLILVIAIVFTLVSAIDNFTSSITSWFGVSEGTTSTECGVGEEGCDADAYNGEKDGLYTDDKYLYNEDGSGKSWEELVDGLNSDDKCKVNSGWLKFWDNIGAAFNGGKFTDECQLLRYIRGNVNDYETRFNVKLDKGLIIATIFYGYDQQASYLTYDEPSETDEIVYSSNHYEVLKNIIKNGNLKRTDVDRIIQSTIYEEAYPQFIWELEKQDDGTYIGYCKMSSQISYKFSLNKWKLFMRWNDEKDESRNGFSVAGYVSVPRALASDKLLDRSDEVAETDLLQMYGSGWVFDTNMNNAWNSTDEECNGTISTDQIAANYSDLSITFDSSVDTAQTFFKEKGMSAPIDVSKYAQKVEDIHSVTKDVFQSGDMWYCTSASSCKTQYIEFEYKHGFAYINFPGFKKADEDPTTSMEYDDALTPKQIETIIEESVDRKGQLNEVLFSENLDEEDSYNGGIDNLGTGVIGTYCGDYLTAALSDIQVRLTDCYGEFVANTNFKDYIIGVTRGEIGYASNDDYVLTQMVAAISYSLNRRNNYTEGTVINMKSGTCDQVWCNPATSCYGKATGSTSGGTTLHSYYPTQVSGSWLYKNALTDEEYARYSSLYDTASDYLVIDNSTEKVMATGYVSTVQNKWSAAANIGKPFTQILQEYYTGSTLVQCSNQGDGDVYGGVVDNDYDTDSQTKVSSSSAYPKTTPNKGKFYGFPYNDGPEGRNINIDPAWKKANLVSVSSNCASGGWSKTYTVNIAAKGNFEKAFASICKLLTTGIDGYKINVSDLKNGGTFVERLTSQGSPSLHGYGLAQDWNYSAEYVIDGVKYSPYNRDIGVYNKFVEALGGDEDDPRNINYILWKYAYQPAGFKWGGNWGRNGSSATYDGMHFEIDWRASS